MDSPGVRYWYGFDTGKIARRRDGSKMKFAFVFPGQGSQSVGMMKSYGDAAVLRETFDEASAAIGADLWQMVSDGPAEMLSQTVNTQPLMLAADVAVYRLWRERGGAEPALVAGHSLGEYAALVVAGVLRFSDAVPLVRLRAQAMQDAVPAGTGAMAALLGLEEDVARAACDEAAGSDVVSCANLNAPGQIVIAGHAAAVQRAIEIAKAKGAKRAVPLPVSAPFHCSLMKPAADRLAQPLASIDLASPTIPVVHNVDVRCHPQPDEIREALVRQAYSPVRWIETIRYMAREGCSHVIECGPGKVLGPLSKRIDPAVTGSSLSDGGSLDEVLAMPGFSS